MKTGSELELNLVVDKNINVETLLPQYSHEEFD